MASPTPCKTLKPSQFRGGFTLTELLVGVMIIVYGLTAAASLFRSTEYTAIKARIEGRVAALVQYHTERMLYIPYSSLAASASTGVLMESGHLHHPSGKNGYAKLYPYTVTTTLSMAGASTRNERISISTVIRWQEPSPDFSQQENIPKELNLGTHTRRRF